MLFKAFDLVISIVTKWGFLKADYADIFGQARTEIEKHLIQGGLGDMKFSDYAQGLLPYISGGVTPPIFFTEIIGNFIQDASMDACMVLKRKEDTRYRYIRGHREITTNDAQYIYDNRDIDKFTEWLDLQMDNSDSFEAVSTWLKENKINHDKYNVGDACAILLEDILLRIITKGNPNSGITDNPEPEYDFKLIDEIHEKIKSLPRPTKVPVPQEV